MLLSEHPGLFKQTEAEPSKLVHLFDEIGVDPVLLEQLNDPCTSPLMTCLQGVIDLRQERSCFPFGQSLLKSGRSVLLVSAAEWSSFQ